MNYITKQFAFCLSLSFIILSCKKENQPLETFTETQVFNDAGTTDISFADKNVGYISGSVDFNSRVAVIAKTVNGGQSWTQIPVYVGAIPSTIIRSIFAKSIDSVYATYHSNTIYGICFSKDGGLTWSNLGSFTVESAYSGIYFKNPQVGFVCRSGDILQTKDGGSTWSTVYDHDGFGGIGKLFFTSSKIGYAYGGFVGDYGSSGTLVKTTDGGDTWVELTSMQKFVSCFSFTDDNTGYAFTFNNDIYKTTDGGITWILLKNMDGQGSYFYSAITSGKTKYLGSGSSIFKSSNDFKTISRIYDSPNVDAEFCIGAIKPSKNAIFFLSGRQSVVKINLNP